MKERGRGRGFTIYQHLHIQRRHIAISQLSQLNLCCFRRRERRSKGIFDLEFGVWVQLLGDHLVVTGEFEIDVCAGEGKIDLGPLDAWGGVVEDGEGVVEHAGDGGESGRKGKC